MTRSIWKGPYCSNKLLRVVEKARDEGVVVIKTKFRNNFIIPEFVGMIFHVYNGKRYIPVKVRESMIGFKLGEFSPTRTYRGHSAVAKVKKGSK